MGNIDRMYGMIDGLVDRIYRDGGCYIHPHRRIGVLSDIQRALDMVQADVQLTIDAIRHEEGL